MEVILLERVERLGQMGDVVTVKAGYARNYLLPRRKALRATKANRERFEKERVELEARNLHRRAEAEAVAERLDGSKIVLIRQAGEGGQLYGSVTARDVGDGLGAAGFAVDRRQLQIDRPIKELGLHDIRVVLHPEVSVTVTANVAQSQDAAVLQAAAAERGEAPTAPAAEAAAAEAPAREAEAEPAPAGKAAKKPQGDRAKAD